MIFAHQGATTQHSYSMQGGATQLSNIM